MAKAKIFVKVKKRISLLQINYLSKESFLIKGALHLFFFFFFWGGGGWETIWQ